MEKLWKSKWSVLTLVQLAMFMALTIVLGYFNKVLPEMPQGGTVSFDIVAIFLCAYFMGSGYGVICGFGVAILQFALGIAQFWGPWSVVLDYVLPLAVCGLAPLLKSTKIGKLDIYWGIILSMVLKYISHVLSGIFLFADPNELHPVIFSLNYNLYYNLGTLILCMIVVPILYQRLKPVFKKN